MKPIRILKNVKFGTTWDWVEFLLHYLIVL